MIVGLLKKFMGVKVRCLSSSLGLSFGCDGLQERLNPPAAPAPSLLFASSGARSPVMDPAALSQDLANLCVRWPLPLEAGSAPSACR